MNLASFTSRATTDDATKPGRFAGRFNLIELINSGGMSDIWLVSDSRGKSYALRRLKKELRFNFTARRRFARGCEVFPS